MGRTKYSPMLFACVALAAACNNDDAVSAPRKGPANDIIPTTIATSATSTGAVTSGVPLANVCLDIKGGTTTAPAAGAPLQAWQCHGGANQQFTLQANGTVTAYGGQRCLDVWGARANDGDAVDAYPCNGGTNQKWTYTAAGELRTAVNGKCLDLWGAQGQNGAPIKVWPCHGGANQKWKLPPAVVSITPPIAITTGGTVSASQVGSAELPRTYLSTAMPAVTGRTISVPAGGDLQGALNAALPGDQIVLAAGATYVGNYVLPVKPGITSSQWITVRTAGPLPAEGTRVTLADAAHMPKILTPNAAAAVATTPGAQGWRLTGVEVGATSSVTMTYTLVSFGTAGSDQQTLAQVPSRLVIDRSYVHGSPTLDVRRCIALNSAATAVIDSYVAECHSRNGDSQAVMGWNGPGPFKIVNNRLEGAHENVAFGGSDPSISGLIPSDIEIRRNYVVKPLSWKGVWTAKNLVEIKAGQRVLMEGNVFENNWVDGQQGLAFVWWSANADGNALWSVTRDITFRSNVVRNVAGGFNLTDHYNTTLPRASRMTIVNNVITGLDGSNGRLYQVNGTLAGLTIANNSGVGINHDVVFVTPDQPLTDFVFRNNVTGAVYTLFAAGYMGNTALTKMGISAANVTGNVFASGSGAGAVPTGNTYVTSVASMIPSLPSSGDVMSSLATISAAGTSGAGANFAAIATATQGVVR